MFPAGVPGITTRFVEVGDGIRLRVLESGSRDGEAVLLLHGWGASAYMQRFALPALANEARRVVAIDLRGHGLSDKPTRAQGLYRIEALTRDVQSLLDVLDIGRAALVGHSMGGGVALRLALEQPERVSSLTLISAVGLRPIPASVAARPIAVKALDRVAKYLVPRWLVGRLLRLTYGDPKRVTERDVDEYWAPAQFPNFARAVRALIREFDWEPLSDSRLNELRAPTLVIVGTLDRLISDAPKCVERLPRARHLVVEGGGHALNEEYPERVNDEIIRFLRSVNEL